MKTCFKCHNSLPLSQFYKHPKMSDGHLNKCKTCTKRDVADRAERMSLNIEWVISERKRQREKSKRARIEGRATKEKSSRSKSYRQKYPERRLAHQMVGNAIRSGKLKRMPCSICGAKAQAHHEDYYKPLEVTWLCVKHHNELHVKLREPKVPF